MDWEAALVAASCVLFVQMGLSEAVQKTLRVHLRILSCPKCLTFWSVLAWNLAHGTPVVVSVAASFLLSYAATWAALILDGLSVLYNRLYETITETDDTSKEAAPGPDDQASGSDEVPKM
jgi:hypothetical protein